MNFHFLQIYSCDLTGYKFSMQTLFISTVSSPLQKGYKLWISGLASVKLFACVCQTVLSNYGGIIRQHVTLKTKSTNGVQHLLVISAKLHEISLRFSPQSMRASVMLWNHKVLQSSPDLIQTVGICYNEQKENLSDVLFDLSEDNNVITWMDRKRICLTWYLQL